MAEDFGNGTYLCPWPWVLPSSSALVTADGDEILCDWLGAWSCKASESRAESSEGTAATGAATGVVLIGTSVVRGPVPCDARSLRMDS